MSSLPRLKRNIDNYDHLIKKYNDKLIGNAGLGFWNYESSTNIDFKLQEHIAIWNQKTTNYHSYLDIVQEHLLGETIDLSATSS